METRAVRWLAGILAAAVLLLCGTAAADIVQWEDSEGKVRTDMRAVVDWGDTVVDGGFVLTVTPSPGAPRVAIALPRLKTIVFQNEEGVPGREFGVTLRDENGARSSFANVRLLSYADGKFEAEPFDRGKRSGFLGTEADSFQGTALNFSGGELPDTKPKGPLDDAIGGAIEMDAAAQQALLDKLDKLEAEAKSASRYGGDSGAEGSIVLEGLEDADGEGSTYGDDIQVDEDSSSSATMPSFPAAIPAALSLALSAFGIVQFIVAIFLAVDAFRNGAVLLGIFNLCCLPVQLYYVWARYEGGGLWILRIVVTLGAAANVVVLGATLLPFLP